MSYTSDEIEQKVSQIIQGSPSFTTDGLGGRNIKERFEATRELVNSTLLYEPDSVFYLIYKAAIRVRYLLKSTLSLMDDLSDDIDGMAVPSKSVQDTTALSDAKTALTSISNALSRRGFISDSEYQRYNKAINRALDRYKAAIKRTYTPFSGTQAVTDAVKSSAEATISIKTNFASFQSSYSTLITSVDNLLNAYDDYDHKEIVKSVASRQMSRITSELSSIESSFNSSTPEKRTETARVDTLSILTNKASVKSLSNIIYPGDPKLQQSSTGSSLYRMSAYGTGTSPSIIGATSGPWPILDSHGLKIDFGGTNVTVPLVPLASSVQGIKEAEITGYKSSVPGVEFALHSDLDTPWPLLTKNIATGGTYTIIGTFLYIVVDGTLFKITDAAPAGFSANLTAAQLASAIGTVAGTHVTATAMTGGGNDWVEIAYKPPASPPGIYRNRYIQVATGASHATTFDGTWRVDEPAGPTAGELSTGWDGNNELWIHPNDLASEVQITLPEGTWPDYVVTTGPVGVAGTILHTIDQASVEITAEETISDNKIKIKSNDLGEGSIVKVTSDGLSVSKKKTASLLGAETLGFYPEIEVREENFSAQALVDVLNSNTSFSDQATASLVRENLLAEKSAYGVTPNIVAIALSSDPSASWTPSELKLIIEAGDSRGSYGVSSVSYGAGILQVTLDRNLRDLATGYRVRIYKELLKITALSSGVSSYIDVDETYGSSAHVVLGLPTTLTRGTVTQLFVERNDPAKGWISANLKGRNIKIGDVIVLEDDSIAATITGINSIGSGILDVSAVSPTLAISAFEIKSVAADNHSSFITSLQTWRDSLTSDEENLSSLAKSVNLLIKLKNPDRGRVQNAANELQAVRDNLEGSSSLTTILSSFTVPALPVVDRALDVMDQQGHDRARDLITSGKFSSFMNTNYKTASSSGAVMSATSDVAISDLVEPTKTRGEYIGQIDKLVSSTWDEVDPKYNFGDIRPDSSPIHLDYFSSDIPGSDE